MVTPTVSMAEDLALQPYWPGLKPPVAWPYKFIIMAATISTIVRPSPNDANCFLTAGEHYRERRPMNVSAHCGMAGGFHPGQFGWRERCSVAYANGVTIALTRDAWSRGCITGAYLMDIAAAFPSVARVACFGSRVTRG